MTINTRGRPRLMLLLNKDYMISSHPADTQCPSLSSSSSSCSSLSQSIHRGVKLCFANITPDQPDGSSSPALERKKESNISVLQNKTTNGNGNGRGFFPFKSGKIELPIAYDDFLELRNTLEKRADFF